MIKKKATEIKVGDVISVNTGYRLFDDEDCEVLRISEGETCGKKHIALHIKSHDYGNHDYQVWPENVLYVVGRKRYCKCGCGRSIDHRHTNAKFLNTRHRTKYWNIINPSGIVLRTKRTMEDYKVINGTAYDEFEDLVYDVDEDEMFEHPFSGDAIGQD